MGNRTLSAAVAAAIAASATAPISWAQQGSSQSATLEEVEQIVDLQMKEIAERLREQGLDVELTEAARSWLAREGFDPQFGARPLRRALQRHVESPLSIRLLRGDFENGSKVVVDAGEDGITFRSDIPPSDQGTELDLSSAQAVDVEPVVPAISG